MAPRIGRTMALTLRHRCPRRGALLVLGRSPKERAAARRPWKSADVCAVAGIGILDRHAHAAIDACVSTREELSQQFLIAQVSSQDITLKVVRGSYDIAGTIWCRVACSAWEPWSLLGGYAPGCATRIVDPANTILSSSGTGRFLAHGRKPDQYRRHHVQWQWDGAHAANAPENDDSVALTCAATCSATTRRREGAVRVFRDTPTCPTAAAACR